MNAAMVKERENGTTSVVVLNLPRHSCIRLDGQAIFLHRDDFVGIGGIPVDSFHLLAVRPSIQTKETTKEPVYASITAGFFLPTRATNSAETPLLVRQYDSQTEEVSNEPLDRVTRQNLQAQIESNSIDPQRLVPYASVLRSESLVLAWHESTAFITTNLLTRRGIRPGTKIVPGFHNEDDQVSDFVNSTLKDGNSPQYPAIPVLEAVQQQHHRRRTTHAGTKQFLQSLTPTQRTSLLTNKDPGSVAFDMVVRDIYQGNWRDLLGDIQLSYTLFLNLHCHASLEHWRDSVALCCRVSQVSGDDDDAFFIVLVQVLSTQLQTMERDFLDDIELSGDNFLVPSLQRLVRTLDSRSSLADTALEFGKRLRDRLPHHFDEILQNGETGEEDRMVLDRNEDNLAVEDDDDDDDAPVVVDMNEIQAAYQRQQAVESSSPSIRGVPQSYTAEMRQRYPILFAAQQPHEDIVMTCARALDVATDVTLVREAADYLEQVEAKQQH